MSGETNLSFLIQNMQPELIKDEFVFASLSNDLLTAIKLNPVCTFIEREGISVIINRHDADLNKIEYKSIFKMITLNIHSSLNAIGFLAKITDELAKHNISVNPVSAYYHDHLFIPEENAEEALIILKQLKK